MKLSLVTIPTLFLSTACSLLGGGNEVPTKNVDPAALQAQAQAATAAPSIDLGKLLGGITDTSSATAAKSPLETAVAQLKTALTSADAKAKIEATAGGSADASGGKKMVDEVLAKFGLGSGTVAQITSLLQNEQVKAVLGPTLEQLKGMLPAGL